MIPLNFYRDDNYVYYNNPNGITKKMTIAEFEAVMSGDGGGGSGGATVVNFVQDPDSPSTVKTDKTFAEIRTAMQSGYVVAIYHVGTQFMLMPIISLVNAYEGEGGNITVHWYGDEQVFFASSDSAYPSNTFD